MAALVAQKAGLLPINPCYGDNSLVEASKNCSVWGYKEMSSAEAH